ncbi:MAG: response regulator [Oscillospiraceae bacterium]|nr:response regulator [Oscillospiraceae bacterium]
MRVLLIEDEAVHLLKYEKCAENLPYEVELNTADGLKKAIKLAEEGNFDAIFLDLELHESDGDGISFLKWLKKTKLKKSPLIIIITINRSYSMHEIVRNLGADYIFGKKKPDYSPRLVFDFAYNCLTSRPKSEQIHDGIEAAIVREVEKIGFTYDISGKNYLVSAVSVIIHAGKNNPCLQKDVYPVIAQKFKKTDWSVNKAIRNAIVKTWRITDLETLQKNYTSNIDYDTGVPTNKQMIMYLADKIKRDCAG